MTAKEANEQADKRYLELKKYRKDKDRDRERCYEEISKAVAAGYVICEVCFGIEDEVKRELGELGYQIMEKQTAHGTAYSIISWFKGDSQ